jgi:hypothetical protein
MSTWIAQDNFVGETAEGAWVTVVKGQPFPDSHPMVALDRDAADKAAKAGITRTALFAPMDFGEADEPAKAAPEPKAAPAKAEPPKAAPSRKGA